MATALLLTRVFVNKDDARKTLNEQPITVRVAEIASIRSSNRLHDTKHRSTITLASGVTYEVAETAAKIRTEVFGSSVKDMRG